MPVREGETQRTSLPAERSALENRVILKEIKRKFWLESRTETRKQDRRHEKVAVIQSSALVVLLLLVFSSCKRRDDEEVLLSFFVSN